MISSIGLQYQEIRHMQSHETKNLLCIKGNVQLSECQITEWEKIFSSSISNKRLISIIHKQLKPKIIKDGPSGLEKMAQ